MTTGLFRDTVFKATILCSVVSCFYFAIRTQIVGFKIAEITGFLNYISSYSFALKNVDMKILENSLKYIYSKPSCL